MRLYGSQASPYVRKVRVLLQEKRIACEFVVEDPWPEGSLIPTRNPLGKVPVLEVGEGKYLFESSHVVHFLDHLEGRPLMPRDPAAYWQAQWWLALGNGIIDALVARVLETRRPQDKQMPEKMEREEQRVHRAVAAAESAFQGGGYLAGDRLSLADLTLGVALQYSDFRYPHDWRAAAPRLAAWHAGIVSRTSFEETLPPGFVKP